MEAVEEVEYVHSDVEKEMLKQFRRMLSDVLKPDDTDAILLKWLRVKNFNLRKCEALFRKDVKSKLVHKTSQLEYIWDVPEVIKKYEYANHIGFAKDGTPIHFVAFGRGDLRGFIMSLDGYDISKYCSCVVETDIKRCKEQSKRLGKEINQVTYIVDMEGFAIRQTFYAGVLEFGFDLLHMLQDHYPEIWKRVLIVNANIFFYSAFNLIKPVLRHTFLQQVQVTSRAHSPSLLLKYVDAEVLPAFLGGKRVDSQGDPLCREFMKFGGEIPESYFLRNRSPLLPSDVGVETVWVPPRGCYNALVIVREADSIIRVEIRLEGGSMPGSILFRKFSTDPENPDLPSKDEYLDPDDEKCNVELISPPIHVQAHLAPINSYCFAPWPGIYIFSFVNSYNWLTSRKVICRFRVLPPNNHHFTT